MGWNLKNFLIAFFSLVIASAVILVAFPLQKPGTGIHYDYSQHRDVPNTVTDLTAIYLILASAAVVLVWLATNGLTENSMLLSARRILKDARNSEDMSLFDIIPSECDIVKHKLLGEYSIGYLRFIWVLNSYRESVYIVAIANDNYRKTTTRQQSDVSIISISKEVQAAETAVDDLTPSERRNFIAQYKAVARKLSELDPDLREKLTQVPEKQLKEDSKEVNR